ncbi:hypothetical protein ABPH35_08225 [Streptococcus sp. ZJ93]|uniref:hypothetical protein n=1 Tax=Streptococcus handemini TaxID=3161188 RepID=UPI0032EF76AF
MITMLSNAMQVYALELEKKYEEVIENRWGWVIVALVVLAAVGLYAWYCTSRGKSFAFNVKFNWPKSGEMGIACH